MVVYPEEIVEMANLLMKDIADSKDNIDANLAASFADRCAELIKNLAESMAEAKILIVYASRTGNTEKLAQAIAEGARSAGGVSVELKRAKDTKPVDAGADAFAFGSHSAFEYMAGELKTVFEDFYPVRDKLAGKPVLIFTTGKGGQVSALESIDKVVGVFNPNWVKPGVAVEGAPKEADKAKAREMGKKLAEAAKKKAK